MQLILTPPPKVMVILKEISFNYGSPDWYPDILPKDTLPKDTLPKDILPNGHLADGHLVERTFCRTDSMTSGLFAEKTTCRK